MSMSSFFEEEVAILERVDPSHPVVRVSPAFVNVGKGALKVLNSGGAWSAGAGSVVAVVRHLLKGQPIWEYGIPIRGSETLVDFAERQLEWHKKNVPDSFITPIAPEIKALIAAFQDKADPHTSNNADKIADAMFRLFDNKTITPVMGTEDEWFEVTDELPKDSQRVFQNKRCSAVFRIGDGKPYYLDAISFETPKGMRWHSNSVIMPNGKKLRSRQFIKSFPFEPKTFVIKIGEKEVAKDDWEFYLTNTKQLKPVFEYYEKPENF